MKASDLRNMGEAKRMDTAQEELNTKKRKEAAKQKEIEEAAKRSLDLYFTQKGIKTAAKSGKLSVSDAFTSSIHESYFGSKVANIVENRLRAMYTTEDGFCVKKEVRGCYCGYTDDDYPPSIITVILSWG